MNKRIVILSTVMMLGAGSLAFACGGDCDKAGKKDMMDMKGMKMHGMMDRSIVATSDGGLVIIKGDHLIKYDRNLRLVNQADLPAMEMGKMHKECPMMKKMEKQGNKGVVESVEQEAAEHQAHH